MIQGGDVLYNNGFGTTSIYGKTFIDEAFTVAHDRPGILSMANAGPDTNGSQWFITTAPAPHLDGRNVAFGQVVVGYDVVKEIEQRGSKDGRPRAQVWITDSGELNETGFLMEVQYERARIEERIAREKQKDIEEIRIYNECKRSGIDYVPRAVRELRLRQQKEKAKAEEEAQFAESMEQEATSMDSEQLLKHLHDLQLQRTVLLSPEDTQKLKPRFVKNLFGQYQYKPELTKYEKEVEKLESKVSAYGKSAADLLQTMAEIRKTTYPETLDFDKARPVTQRLDEGLNQVKWKQMASLPPPYLKRIDMVLGHSEHSAAPLTPEIIMTSLRQMRRAAYTAAQVGEPSEIQKLDIDALDQQLYSALLVINAHPSTRRLSNRLSTTQEERLEFLINELTLLKSSMSPSLVTHLAPVTQADFWPYVKPSQNTASQSDLPHQETTYGASSSQPGTSSPSTTHSTSSRKVIKR